MPAVNGTVAAMYMYNVEQEIDIETLSSVSPHQSYFAVHPGLIEDGHASHLTHDNHWLGFDPSLVSKCISASCNKSHADAL